MDSTIPWYQSAIVRQQIAQLVVTLTALLGVNLGGLDVDATLVSVFSGIGAVIAVVTLVTRIFKPAPNLSQTAVDKEVEMVRDLKIPPSPTGPKQAGFARLSLVAVIALAAAALALVVLPGCTGTRAAYKAAPALEDTAYVVAEHYAAVVHEAADLAALPTTAPEVRDALKKADAAVKPWILGDAASGRAGLRDLAQRYASVRNAETEEQLQAAVNAAVLELAKFINAVKAARR